MKNALLCLWALSAAAAGMGLERFSPPAGDYSIEHPSSWRRSFGRSTLGLRPPGQDGKALRFRLEEHDGDAPTFVEGLASQATAVKTLASRTQLQVAGRAASRLEFIETVPLKSRLGGPLPGPAREVFYVVPRRKGFLVLAWEGFGEGCRRRLPELEAIVASLKLASGDDAP